MSRHSAAQIGWGTDMQAWMSSHSWSWSCVHKMYFFVTLCLSELSKARQLWSHDGSSIVEQLRVEYFNWMEGQVVLAGSSSLPPS